MSVYMLIEIKIKKLEMYQKYINSVREIVERNHGKYLVRGGKTYSFAGDWNPERVILLQFESLDQLKACFESDEYKAIAPLREQSTETRALIMEGFPTEP